jgi:hypothetical protein
MAARGVLGICRWFRLARAWNAVMMAGMSTGDKTSRRMRTSVSMVLLIFSAWADRLGWALCIALGHAGRK